MEQSQFIIYGLVDPRNGELRYVGQSSRGFDRPMNHWNRKRCREANDHCHCWIKNVLSDSLIPEIEVLQECTFEDELSEAEIFWIAYFKAIGCRLTNATLGGEGTRGFVSPMKGKKHSEETKKKISIANLGKISWNKNRSTKLSHAEAYSKSGAKQRLRKGTFSEETKRKIGEASSKKIPWNKGKTQKGHPHTKEFKEMMKNRIVSDETRQRMRLSAKKRWGKE